MSSFGGTVKLSGESEYKKALSDIISNLKVMSSEMQIVTATYGRNDKSVQGLSERNQVLNRQIEAQKDKVEVLKSALESAKNETGENSSTTQKWQTELNKATAQLVSMEKEVKDNEETMKKSSDATDDNADKVKKFGDEADKTGKKTITLGDIIKANLISDAIKKGISELVDGMKKLGSMFIDVGKQALESYGDYEQLVGGVETLFKDSADKVQNYANNAYKTSGLSANQYMETVTSFSASLLQSLNGDTAKSAEVADMAITDMSDNANKMGTSMEMIQNAYQGFAKQNYTMLDNLKLGYGGTKSEMERLLADAEKISGIKYDISNLNDVYQAIHVIQGELGITGTTAKEASTTIQGSVASLKSAWGNMLVGIADDNANFEGLVTNLIDSLLTAMDNIIPRVEIIIGGIGDMIVAFADQILPKLLEIGINTIENLVQGMSSNMPKVLESVNTIITNLIGGLNRILPQITTVAVQVIMQLANTLIQNLPQIIECGIQVLLSLIDGLVKTIPDLIPTIVQAVITIVETLIDHLDEIIDAGIEIMFALIDGLIKAMPDLIDKIPEIIDKLIMAITNNLPKLIQAGITLTIKLAEGLIKAIPQLVSKIPQIITSLVKGLGNGIKQMAEVGLNMIKGLWDGIKNSLSWIKDKIKGWVGDVFKFIKKLFGINSPSTLFRDEIGSNLAKGIGIGFSDEMDTVNKDIMDAIPTDYDLGVNTTLHNDITSSFNNNTLSQSESFASAVKEALNGMYVKLDGDKVGEIVVNTVEDVIYT